METVIRNVRDLDGVHPPNKPYLNDDGTPVDCSRVYLGDHRWEHPDLGVTFVFNDERTPIYLDLPSGYRVVVAL